MPYMTLTAYLSGKGKTDYKILLLTLRSLKKRQNEQFRYHKQIMLNWKTWHQTEKLEYKGECTANKPCVIVGPRVKHHII